MLNSLLDEFRGREQQFTVYRSGDELELEAWLANQGIAVKSRSLPAGGPAPLTEITTDEGVVGTVAPRNVRILVFRRPVQDD